LVIVLPLQCEWRNAKKELVSILISSFCMPEENIHGSLKCLWYQW
jgi:hypothetical protein